MDIIKDQILSTLGIHRVNNPGNLDNSPMSLEQLQALVTVPIGMELEDLIKRGLVEVCEGGVRITGVGYVNWRNGWV